MIGWFPLKSHARYRSLCLLGLFPAGHVLVVTPPPHHSYDFTLPVQASKVIISVKLFGQYNFNSSFFKRVKKKESIRDNDYDMFISFN